MVALQIRNVPADIQEALTEKAVSRGQSLQAFLLSLVTDEARRSHNPVVLRRFENRRDGTDLSAADVTEALDQARAQRQAVFARPDHRTP